MRMSVRVDGVDRVLANFSLFDLEMTKEIRKGLSKSGTAIKKRAKIMAPKDPNHEKHHAARPNEKLAMTLSQSIKMKYSRDRLSIAIYPRRYYGHWVEFGTEHSKKQPFLHPAFEAEVNTYVRNIEKAVSKIIQRRMR